MSSVSDMDGLETGQHPVAIIGAGLDLGAGRRGVDMGPSAIRYAGLDERIGGLGYEVDDRGNVGTAARTSPRSTHVRPSCSIRSWRPA